MHIRRGVISFAIVLSLAGLARMVRAETYVVFSQDFIRATGAPVTVTEQFAAVDQSRPYTIRIYSGGKNQQFGKVVSSAVITLNGQLLVEPQEFNQRVKLIEKQFNLLAQNEVVVELRSAPGSGITIEILGTVELELAYTEDLELVWWNPPYVPCMFELSPSPDWLHFGAFYRPIAPVGFHALGHYGDSADAKSCNQPAPRGFMLVAKELEPGALAKPRDYVEVWRSTGALNEPEGSFWQPLPQPGYVCLGMVAQGGHNKPDLDEIRCVRQDLTVQGRAGSLVWNTDRGSGSEVDFGAWRIKARDPYGIDTGGFVGSNSPRDPPPPPFFSCIDARQVRSVVDGLFKIDSEDIQQLVQRHGPLLQLHPDERFLPDDAEFSLDFAKLDWGLVQNETSYDSFNFQLLGSTPTSALRLMNDVQNLVEIDPNYASPSFRHFLRLPMEWGAPYTKPGDGSGSLTRAKAYVRVLPWNWLFTELQFWLFYPFNGPGRVEACASGNLCAYLQLGENGRHYGDWEEVSLRVLNSTRQLAAVYISRHDAGQWFLRRNFGNALKFNGTHPWIYVAKYSHAHYPTPGYHDYKRTREYDYGLGTASIDLYDLTGNGAFFPVHDPGSYSVISSAMPNYQVSEPDWVWFKGRWGQYERLAFRIEVEHLGVTLFDEVGSGPTGPAMKDSWTAGQPGPGLW